MSGSALGRGGEFDRIRAIEARLGDRAGPLGDDCAVIPDEPGTLVTSVDQAMEETHFRRAWLSLEEIGWRAASAALSDLAAAGARCVGLLAAVRAPRSAAPEDGAALMAGMGDAVLAVGGKVLGGDLGASDRWSIVTTVFGRAGRLMSRRGARPGDQLWVTGSLGGARAAMMTWTEGREPDRYTRTAFAHPTPRLKAGQWLAAHDATAMIDLSDGLAGDAGHLAAASGVELIIELERLPLLPEVAPVAEAAGVTPEEFAASGGEDYELLVTLPPMFSLDDAERCLRETGTRLSRIGRVERGGDVILLLEGRPVELLSYDHFAG
jgi:thiamine-monophosphate kinase